MATLSELLEIGTHRLLTPDERKEMEVLLSGNDVVRSAEIMSAYMAATVDATGMDNMLAQSIVANIIEASREQNSLAHITRIHRIHFLRTAWFRYAAAILLIVTGVFIYYKFAGTASSETTLVKNGLSISNDVLPGTNRALLTLSNGRQVELDSAASETITDGSLSIKNNKGQLIYSGSGFAGYNTMSTPRGGQYQLTLSDGTRVWLNAASSITYPVTFSGSKRQVSITGEVYFEVVANKEKPFIVKAGNENITVLGTSFNVNAYADEAATKTSLVEGAIKIGNIVVKPGQAYTGGKIIKTDISQDLAWKNGAFNFKNVKADVVLRQISRWYDIDIRYESGIPTARITGEMGRDLNLSQVLGVLEGLEIHTKLNGKTLLILSE